jgi:hypothetical protein
MKQEQGTAHVPCSWVESLNERLVRFHLEIQTILIYNIFTETFK